MIGYGLMFLMSLVIIFVGAIILYLTFRQWWTGVKASKAQKLQEMKKQGQKIVTNPS